MLQLFVVFAFLNYGLGAPVPESGKLSTNPEQIHLSLNEHSQIVVTWSTMLQSKGSLVQFGTDTDLNQIAQGSFAPFTDPASKTRTQFIHRVTLTGLKTKTKYFYRCGDSFTWSRVYHFTTPGDSSSKTSFAVYGDFGVFNAQSLTRLVNETEAEHFDAILHVGDLAYDMINDNSTRGDEYMRMIEPMAAQVPYMTCPGNHEYHFNFSNYVNRFSMPNREQMFYSVNIGPVHVVSVNTEYYYFVQFGVDQIFRQYDWLKADLENANKPENRAKQPWIVTIGHRPMYCSNNNWNDCTFYNRDLVRVGLPLLHWYGLEKLFYDNGVDLEVWAHEHSYERLWPIMDKKVYNGSKEHPYTNPGAPVHVTTGSAGCQEKHDPFDPYDRPPFTAFRSTDYGYSRMTAFNATHLTFEQVSDDQKGKIIDKITIIKDKHTYPPR